MSANNRPLRPCGTDAAYQRHLKRGEATCGPCREAHAYKTRRYVVAYGLGHTPTDLVPIQGTVRRIQALACLGWNAAVVWKLAGRPYRSLASIQRRQRIRSCDAEAIAAVFERLCMTPAPLTTTTERRHAARAFYQARSGGWSPPLAWDDIDNDHKPATAVIEYRTAA